MTFMQIVKKKWCVDKITHWKKFHPIEENVFNYIFLWYILVQRLIIMNYYHHNWNRDHHYCRNNVISLSRSSRLLFPKTFLWDNLLLSGLFNVTIKLKMAGNCLRNIQITKYVQTLPGVVWVVGGILRHELLAAVIKENISLWSWVENIL